MSIHGIHNVRGGIYQDFVLSLNKMKYLILQIKQYTQEFICFGCGKNERHQNKSNCRNFFLRGICDNCGLLDHTSK